MRLVPPLAACSQLGVWATIWPWPFAPRAGLGVLLDGEAGAELGMEECSPLEHEVGWSSALPLHPHPSLEKHFLCICRSFHMLATLLQS